MNILVAAEGRTTAHALRSVLEGMGHHVTLADSGDGVSRVLDAGGDCRVLIADWRLPGMEGQELCRRLRAGAWEGGNGAYRYVILMTNRDDRADRLAALADGADDFLEKPAGAEELAVRLGVACKVLNTHDELAKARDDMARQDASLSEFAMTDHLTGVGNRRAFADALRTATSFAGRHELPLSLAMVDVDHFKAYNDAFGHPAGDDALRAVAATLRGGLREHDVLARYGGEEFALILPVTEIRPAKILAERLRVTIARHPWPLRPVTASFGLATVSAKLIDGAALVEQADRALYRSKALGRDRVTHAAEQHDMA